VIAANPMITITTHTANPTTPSTSPATADDLLFASPLIARLRPIAPKITARMLSAHPVNGIQHRTTPMIPSTSAAVPSPLRGAGYAPYATAPGA
jgi:hypothetical protein